MAGASRKWLANEILERKGGHRGGTYPACAKFKFGNSRMEYVRFAVDVPVGLAGRRGTFPVMQRPIGVVGGEIGVPPQPSAPVDGGCSSTFERECDLFCCEGSTLDGMWRHPF